MHRTAMKCAIMMGMGMLMFACGGSVCPERPCLCGSEPERERAVAWESLDATTRAQYKARILDEITDEMRAAWQRSWCASLEGASREGEREGGDESASTAPEDLAASRAGKAQVWPMLPPTQTIERDSGGLKMIRHVLTTGVEHRLPLDERQQFSTSDASIYCFAEISASEIERMVTFKFIHSTGLSQSYSLPIGQSPAWRTWAKLNLTRSMTGAWLCEIFNEDNVLLSSQAFYVEE